MGPFVGDLGVVLGYMGMQIDKGYLFEGPLYHQDDRILMSISGPPSLRGTLSPRPKLPNYEPDARSHETALGLPAVEVSLESRVRGLGFRVLDLVFWGLPEPQNYAAQEFCGSFLCYGLGPLCYVLLMSR